MNADVANDDGFDPGGALRAEARRLEEAAPSVTADEVLDPVVRPVQVVHPFRRVRAGRVLAAAALGAAALAGTVAYTHRETGARIETTTPQAQQTPAPSRYYLPSSVPTGFSITRAFDNDASQGTAPMVSSYVRDDPGAAISVMVLTKVSPELVGTAPASTVNGRTVQFGPDATEGKPAPPTAVVTVNSSCIVQIVGKNLTREIVLAAAATARCENGSALIDPPAGFTEAAADALAGARSTGVEYADAALTRFINLTVAIPPSGGPRDLTRDGAEPITLNGHPAFLFPMTTADVAAQDTKRGVMWADPSGAIIQVAAVGIDQSQLLAVASSIAPVSSDQWHAAVGSKLRTADIGAAKEATAAAGGTAGKSVDSGSTTAGAKG